MIYRAKKVFIFGAVKSNKPQKLQKGTNRK
ncbi:hypothetical protein OPIT5_15970 [Opitutaceae bacterium TAV5]|nr:hypothetical protein OPIT5_15970 [Opitutaceae bacterium TAV5]